MQKPRGHYKLTPELIERVRKLRRIGFSQKDCAAACGIDVDTLGKWIAKGKTTDGTDLECRLYRAIHGASMEGAEQLVQRIFDGDSRDAQWLLTHSPEWRDSWSDAAHVRREVSKVLTSVVQVIQSSDLTPEQQEALLLRMSAAGIGASC